MVKIRLVRRGKKKYPTYKFAVADSKTPRNGKMIALLGYYNPHKPDAININSEQTKNWLDKGAQPTESVKNLLKKIGFAKL